MFSNFSPRRRVGRGGLRSGNLIYTTTTKRERPVSFFFLPKLGKNLLEHLIYIFKMIYSKKEL